MFYKLTASFSGTILVNFITTFVFTWICLASFKTPFNPAYYLSLYFIYSLIPIFFWLVLNFTLVVIFSDAKIYYPIMLFIWLVNQFPTKYFLGYSNWRELNLKNPLANAGLWTNRVIYLVISVIILFIGLKLLDVKRRNIFNSASSGNLISYRGTDIFVYNFKNSKLAGLLASYKINLSWKFIFGVVIFATSTTDFRRNHSKNV